MKRKFGAIIQIGDILVSEDVVTEYFACDYESCRGACCIIGDSGAPLKEEEIDSLERDYPRYEQYMRPQGRQAAQDAGFVEVDRDGDLVTPLANGAECAYCHFGPGGECLCAIEMASCRKPVSCSLYPIRVTPLTGGGQALNLHKWEICRCAFDKGRREGVRAYQFLEGVLRRTYGDEFYEALSAAATHLLESE